MQRGIRTAWLVMMLLLGGAPAWAEEYTSGDKVVVIESGNLTNKKGKVVDHTFPGQVLKIEKVDGEWLWIRTIERAKVSIKSVVSLDQQVLDRFTLMIQENPTAALYYGRAVIRRHLGEVDLAMADHVEAIRLDP